MSLNLDLLTHTACFANLKDIDNMTRVSKVTLNHFKSLDKNSAPVVHKRKLLAKQSAIYNIRNLYPRTTDYEDDSLDDLDEFLENKMEGYLRNDIDVMMQAVKKNGRNLRFASSDLKANRKIVLEAVKNGMALDLACETLRADREIVLEAVKNSRYAIKYVPQNLQHDPEILKIVTNPPKLEEDWEECWRVDDTPQGGTVYYENPYTEETSFKRPVGREFSYNPEPLPEHYYYRQMTIKKLRELLKANNIKFTTKLKKSELQELVRKNFVWKAV